MCKVLSMLDDTVLWNKISEIRTVECRCTCSLGIEKSKSETHISHFFFHQSTYHLLLYTSLRKVVLPEPELPTHTVSVMIFWTATRREDDDPLWWESEVSREWLTHVKKQYYGELSEQERDMNEWTKPGQKMAPNYEKQREQLKNVSVGIIPIRYQRKLT